LDPLSPIDDDDSPVDCIDLREDREPSLADSYFIEVPPMVVPPATETLFCFYGTYEGPDGGIVSFIPEKPEGFLHHSLMKRVDDDFFPDGALMDCSKEEDQFLRPTLVEAYDGDGGDWIRLPEGIGFKLEEGQRWMADIHYVNSSKDTLCVNTSFELEVLPDEDIVAYAGTFNLDGGKLNLPPNSASSKTFACAWPFDVNILSLGGHMHGFGSSYEVQKQNWTEQTSEVVYDVDPWLPDYRYEAPLEMYHPSEFHMKAGEALQTECSWVNPTDDTLGFPDEMCTTFGVAYPLETSVHCDDGFMLGVHTRRPVDYN